MGAAVPPPEPVRGDNLATSVLRTVPRAASMMLGVLALVACIPSQPGATAGQSAAPATPSIARSGSDSELSKLRSPPPGLTCDAMGVPYGSARIQIDGEAADPVTALTDANSSLKTYWSPGFALGLATDAVADWVVRDPNGQVVASQGERLDIPAGAWPRLHGYFVCPTADALYVLLEDPA